MYDGSKASGYSDALAPSPGPAPGRPERRYQWYTSRRYVPLSHRRRACVRAFTHAQKHTEDTHTSDDFFLRPYIDGNKYVLTKPSTIRFVWLNYVFARVLV